MSPSLMPHAVCWSQDPPLVWTMVITNGITFLSYFSICLTLFYLARKTLPGGREAHAYPILYGARIGVGPAGSKGYDEVW